jgi:TolA-binding protein
MNTLISRAAVAVLLCVLTACHITSQRVGDLDEAQRLSDLEPLPAPQQTRITEVEISQVVAGYQAALRWEDSPIEREKIARRLAVLQLRGAEEQQINSGDNNAALLYADVIVTYKMLLKRQTGRSDTDQLLYPLAKAYEYSGNLNACLQTLTQLVRQYPQSDYYVEAQFRRAELLFSSQRYADAFKAYEAVYLRDDTNKLANNAAYMAGWSQFKLASYAKAITLFATVLDRIGFQHYAKFRVTSELLTTEDNLVAQPDIAGNKARLQYDIFRVMAYAFSYAGGAADIGQMLDKMGEREYAYLLYQDLGKLYLDKKRFRDSAQTFGHFVSRYPLVARAPQFKQWQIDAFAQGGFPADVRAQKKQFAERYAIDGEFWLAASAPTRLFVRSKLEHYIDELARYHHAMAQRGVAETTKPATAQKNEQEPVEHFAQAAIWYQTWIKSFPEHSDRLQRWFLLGEVRSQSGDGVGAISAYAHAAYNETVQPNLDNAESMHKQQRDAGYAAWLLYDNEIAKHKNNREQQQIWQEQKIASAVLFADTFADDPRVAALLAKTTNEYFSLSRYTQTIDTADRLLQMPTIEDNLTISVLLASAHASTELQRYDAAEYRYAQVLALLDQSANQKQHAEHHTATLDNYAASIYRQGELMAKNGAREEAATHYMRVAELAPSSALAATALHDAGVLLGQLEHWPAAISAMEALKLRYPSHASVGALPARLLHARQSMGDYAGAAAQAIAIAKYDPDSELRRQALYSAAELYQQANDTQSAIATFKEYAHTYARPVGSKFEAMYQLTLLYKKTKQPSKRNYWLDKLITVNQQIKAPSDRTNYLAGYAQKEFAQSHFNRYKKLALTQPINKSLPEKRKAMGKAIDAYKKLAAYQIDEYAIFATHQMGEIYIDLASALLDSERPQGLDTLALEQYELLLEEQAFPFEEQAIELLMVNVERCWKSVCDASSALSYQALAKLIPARFDKHERILGSSSIAQIVGK